MRIPILLITAMLLLSFQGNPVSVDDFKKEMKVIKDAMDGKSYYEVESSYKMYDVTTGKVFETALGRYVKKGSSFYNKISFVETVHSDTYSLIIDNSHRFIIIDTVINSNSAETNMMLRNIDTMDFSRVLSISTYKPTANLKGYEIRFNKKSATLNKFKFEYDVKSNLPTKIVMFMTEKIMGKTEDEIITPRMEMEFSKYSTVDAGGGQLTNPLNFVARANGKWIIIKDKYKGYSIKKAH